MESVKSKNQSKQFENLISKKTIAALTIKFKKEYKTMAFLK